MAGFGHGNWVHTLAFDLEWEVGVEKSWAQETPQRQQQWVRGAPRAAVAAVLMSVSGVQVSSSGVRAAASEPDAEVVASSGGPFGGDIWGIFPGHISLNPVILWLSWKFFNLLGDLPLYKFPSCIISQMHFYSENLGTPMD